MEKTLILQHSGHFHTEINPEMKMNLSRWATMSLKIKNLSKNRNTISIKETVFSIFVR
jgi:hypothetical protein